MAGKNVNSVAGFVNAAAIAIIHLYIEAIGCRNRTIRIPGFFAGNKSEHENKWKAGGGKMSVHYVDLERKDFVFWKEFKLNKKRIIIQSRGDFPLLGFLFTLGCVYREVFLLYKI